MKKYFAVLVVLLLCVFCAVFAEDLPKVAQVAEIKGTLEMKKPSEQGWSCVSVKTPAYIQDQFKTDENSVADLEFLVGGHVGINKNTIIEITGVRDAKDVTKKSLTQKIILKAGAVWAKFSGQDKSLQFQTQGGVLAIKGTEFVVEENPASKETKVYVLEGEVAYTTPKEEIKAKAGDKITMPWENVPVVKHYEPAELKNECKNNFAELYEGIKNILQFVGMAQSFSGASVMDTSSLGYASMAVDVINNPADAVKNYAVNTASSYVPGPFGSLISSAASNESKEEKKPDFPTGLSPDQTEICDANPYFSWGSYEGADSYLVLLSPKEDMKDLYWSQQVTSTSVQYPSWAKTLEKGVKYYWRVIAVCKDAAKNDKPLSKASQTFFNVVAAGL